mgnify:CR=1 FL=1
MDPKTIVSSDSPPGFWPGTLRCGRWSYAAVIVGDASVGRATHAFRVEVCDGAVDILSIRDPEGCVHVPW